MSETTKVPENLQYTATHEWVRVEGSVLTMGITDHAQSELTDVVYVTLPAVGQPVHEKQVLLTLESVKTVADVYAPANGKVARVNEELTKDPGLVNKDPYGKGWILAIEFSAPPTGLLSAEKYKSLAASH